MEETNQFNQWLKKELSRRGWSEFRLAKEAGLSHGSVYRIGKGARPGWKAAGAIAAALGMPEELVFRKAGLLGEENGGEVDLEEWKAVLVRLEEKEREELLRIAYVKIEMREEGG